jgi:predicted HTH domain antitoxin
LSQIKSRQQNDVLIEIICNFFKHFVLSRLITSLSSQAKRGNPSPQLKISSQATFLGETMQLVLEVPSNLPDAAHCTQQEFLHEAKLSMAVKLFEMKRLSSGMAASLIGMGRVEFLAELHRYGVPMIDLDQDDLAQDIANA